MRTCDSNMKLLSKIFLAAALLYFCPAAFGDELTGRKLTIEVTNGTINGSAVVGDEINVNIYHHKELIETLEGRIGDNDTAVFENVQADEHSVGIASVKHQDMIFNGRAFKLESGKHEIKSNVLVFDVSTDISNLSIQTHHFIIKVGAEALQINEYLELENSSDMAIYN